jgi:hypothetical protein
MPQIGTGVLLYAGILSFDPFEICAGRLINALQFFKNVILVVRFFVNRSPGTEWDGPSSGDYQNRSQVSQQVWHEQDSFLPKGMKCHINYTYF